MTITGITFVLMFFGGMYLLFSIFTPWLDKPNAMGLALIIMVLLYYLLSKAFEPEVKHKE